MKARVDGVTFSGAAGNRIGVVAFATQSSVECPITSDKAQLLNCIDDIGYTGGWTYMADAIQLAGDHMDRMSSSQRTRVIERVLLFLTPLFLCVFALDNLRFIATKQGCYACCTPPSLRFGVTVYGLQLLWLEHTRICAASKFFLWLLLPIFSAFRTHLPSSSAGLSLFHWHP